MENRFEIRIALSHLPFHIPYDACKRQDGENFGYRSLIKNPELIDEIPELFNETVMKKFIGQINAPNGFLETARMLHWTNSGNGKFERAFCFGFIFRDRRFFSTYQNCFMLAGSLLDKICKDNIVPDAPFLFEIQPVILLEENVSGSFAVSMLRSRLLKNTRLKPKLAQ